MTDWTNEEEEAFNDVEKHSNLGKQILRDIEGQPYVYAPKREWANLTDREMMDAINLDDTPMEMGRKIEATLRSKNT